MHKPAATGASQPSNEAKTTDDPRAAHELWRALLRRWFIEYNPLYLVSATLVLVGTTLISRGVAQEELHLGGIFVGAVAEIYAFALISGVAFLTRIRQHRAAALLALLAVLYQCDLTLQVETYAYYGWAGELASTAWVIVFAAKLYALSRALRLRLSSSAFGVPVLGAMGLAVLPHVALPHVARGLDADIRTMLVSLFVFGLGAAGLWTSRTVRADFELDVRARRALKGTWILWAVATLAHVLFWVGDIDLQIVGLLPPLVLLGFRWVRAEVWHFVGVGCALVLVGVFMPSYLSMTALMAGATLALRALRRPTYTMREPRATRPTEPYRTPGSPPVFETPPPPPAVTFRMDDRRTVGRLLVGALSCNYLCIWTYGWGGGATPEHAIWLDIVFVALSVGLFHRMRARTAVIPVSVVLTHLAVQLGWIASPRGALQLGAAVVGVGFAVLLGALFASWYVGSERSTAPVTEATPPSRG